MLGEIKDDLKEIIGVDFVGLWGRKNFWGFIVKVIRINK